MRQRARVDEPFDGLPERHERADEDGQHHREARPPLTACAPQEEGDGERDRRQRVTEVMDQVGEQGDTQRLLVDERLRQGRQGQDGEAPRDGPDTRPRADDRRIDQAVRVPVMIVVVTGCYERL